MASLLSTLLLATSVSAQYTTSFWQPSAYGAIETVGYVGSVMHVDDDGVYTVKMDWDDGVDREGLGVGPDASFVAFGGSITISPKTMVWRDDSPERCTKPDLDKNTVTCSWVFPATAVARSCELPSSGAYLMTETQTHLYTYTHSFPARGTQSAGTQTVTESLIIGPDRTTTPEWCNTPNFTPEAETVYWTKSDKEVWTMQLVITAGLEKLGIEATATAPPTTVSGSQTSSLPQETNAAAQLVPGTSVMMGLGAAVAAFVL